MDVPVNGVDDEDDAADGKAEKKSGDKMDTTDDNDLGVSFLRAGARAQFVLCEQEPNVLVIAASKALLDLCTCDRATHCFHCG